MGNVRPLVFSKLRAIFALSFFFTFDLCVCAASGSAADAEADPQRQAWFEQDIDRPGSDFQVLWLREGPEACQAACAQHPLCRSYTYVRPGIPGRPEGCWLKNAIPAPVADGCCVSGAKAEEALAGILRQRTAISEEAVIPEPAPEPAIPPEAPRRGIHGAMEKLPVTGSGRRIAADLRFSAIRPPAASTLGTGTERRVTKRMDFTAVPLSESSSGSKSVAGTKLPFGESGLRKVAWARYTATAPAGTYPDTEVPLRGAATRTVSGVNVSAVPPRR